MSRINFRILSVFLLMLMSYTVKSQNKEAAIVVKAVRNTDNSVDFTYEKNKPGTYKITIKFNSLANTFANDYEGMVKYDSGNLLTLRPDKSDTAITYGYSVSYVIGNWEPKVDSLFHYVLPFKKGKNYPISESSNLNEKYFGSKTINTWKAYFVSSKTADTICAMRKGIVVELKNEYVTDTLVTGYIYSSKRNSVKIEHEDGTYASYFGLKMNSFMVKLGETVFPATPLAVLDKFNNKTFNLHFYISYVGNKDYVYDPEAKLKTAQTPYDYVTPYFYTAEGIVQIVPKSKYTADYNPEIITKEMNKKELKLFLKKK